MNASKELILIKCSCTPLARLNTAPLLSARDLESYFIVKLRPFSPRMKPKGKILIRTHAPNNLRDASKPFWQNQVVESSGPHSMSKTQMEHEMPEASKKLSEQLTPQQETQLDSWKCKK